MKPRELAAKMIERMNRTAARVWNEHKDELEVTDLEEGKGLVWLHVKLHYGKAETPKGVGNG